ncbi:MAG: nucleotidyltransferase family protein [Pseudomonadota bacterium]
MALGRSPRAGEPRTWSEPHVAVARSHLLGPWLYHELRNTPRPRVPESIIPDLRRDYLLSSLAAMEREAHLDEMLALFHSNGIQVVLLKGAYLGRVVYRNPALRPMYDVDILVPEDRYEQAGQLLASLGYTLQVDALHRFHRELNPALAYIHKSRPRDAVDLHHGLWFMDYYRLSPSIVREEVVESRPPGRDPSYLSRELNFIHIALHNLTHADGLRDWLDLVLIVNHPDFRWNKLADLAQSLGVLRPLYWTFRELSAHWGIIPPLHVVQAMAEYTPHWLEDRVIHHKLRYAWRIVSRVRSIDGRRAKLAYVRSGLFPSPAYREAVCGTTGWLPYVRAKLGLFLHFTR